MAKAPSINKGKTVKIVKTGQFGKVSAVRNEGRGDWIDVKISTGSKPSDCITKSFRRTALELVI
jgi:hypothetical protein